MRAMLEESPESCGYGCLFVCGWQYRILQDTARNSFLLQRMRKVQRSVEMSSLFPLNPAAALFHNPAQLTLLPNSMSVGLLAIRYHPGYAASELAMTAQVVNCRSYSEFWL